MLTFVGFSPAWQQVYQLQNLPQGGVERALAAYRYASGKATNAAVVATRYTNQPVHLATVVGGTTGQLFESDLFRHRLRLSLIRAEPTRVCTTLVPADGPVTEIVENATATTTSVAEEMHRNVRRSRSTAIACCGSVPHGISEDVYAKLVRLTDGPTIVDAAGPTLLAALAAEPTLVKPNLAELNATLHQTLPEDTDQRSDRLVDAMNRLRDLGAKSVLVTNGVRPAVLVTDDGVETFPTPKIDSVVNPIGAGDALTGVALAALEGGASVVDAVGIGIDAATEKCRYLRPEDLPVVRGGD